MKRFVRHVTPALLALALVGCARERVELRAGEPSYRDMIPAVADDFGHRLAAHDFGATRPTVRVIVPITIEQRSSEKFDTTLYVQAIRNALATGKCTYTEEVGTPWAVFGRVAVISRPGEANKTTNFTVELKQNAEKPVVTASQDFPWKTE